MVLKTLGTKVKSLVGEDRGVSPVIGVILMVAITVILAAVIGAFVLGLGDDMGASAQAGVSIDETAGQEVIVQLTDAGNVDSVEVHHNGGSAWLGAENDPQVGSTVEISATGDLTLNTDAPIVVVGTLNGEETVIRTYEPSS